MKKKKVLPILIPQYVLYMLYIIERIELLQEHKKHRKTEKRKHEIQLLKREKKNENTPIRQNLPFPYAGASTEFSRSLPLSPPPHCCVQKRRPLYISKHDITR